MFIDPNWHNLQHKAEIISFLIYVKCFEKVVFESSRNLTN